MRCLTAIVLAALLAGCSTGQQDFTQLSDSDELIVLAHGLGRSGVSMSSMAGKFESQGFHVCVIDYSTIGQSVSQVLNESHQQISDCMDNDSRVHFVGHSLGGLVIRAYLSEHPEIVRSDRFGEVVLMGTPNHGSEVADHYREHFLMDWAGETSQSLVTGEDTLGARLASPDYRPGVIAGTSTLSATREMFSGPNDGLVSVESTRLDNMKDFVMVSVGHTAMRWDQGVADQAVHFIRYGKFLR